MKNFICRLTIIIIPLLWVSSAYSEESAPWGKASPENIKYSPQKVVYDVSVRDVDELGGILDRVSYLNNIYLADPFEESIVMVLHGDEIPFFAIKNSDEYSEIMLRAQSLTVAGPIEFRMCEVAARAHGFEPEDIHGFVKVVPMADAELVRLQQEEGYAYMR